MKKIIIFGGIGLVVVIIAVVAVFFFMNQEPKEEPIVYSEYPLEEQYTNLTQAADSTATRKTVLKYTPVIQYTGEEMLTLLPTKQTEILNEYRKYFMSRTADQLSRLDRVQEDLIEITIEIMESDTDTITNVFFLDFIIQ